MPHDLPINPLDVVQLFETNVAHYTGAPCCVAVDSGSNALLLALARLELYGHEITIPKRTCPSVPQAIINAAGWPLFEDLEWSGTYRLKPFLIWDSARRFTRGMYVPGQTQCCSFAGSKHLKIGRGGAILTDDAQAAAWYRLARNTGRPVGVDDADAEYTWGIPATLTIEQAATGLRLLWQLPDHNADLPNDYPDISGKGLWTCTP